MGRFIPQGDWPRYGRWKAARHVLLACGLLAAAVGGSSAQAPEVAKSYWVPTRSFNIPFNIDNARVVEVVLHVSDNNQPYRQAATARPADRRFYFQAPADGWYFFVVQMRDRDGRLTPPDLQGAAPNSKICVDTQKPVIHLQAAPPPEGYAASIQWTIEDANFEGLRADYRSSNGGEWLPMFVPQTATGRHEWTPAVPGDLEVCMQAWDKAKNQAALQYVTVKQAAVRPGSTPPNPAGPGDVKHVNTLRFQLEYQLDDSTVGPSQVKSVDIWKMRQGGPWQKCGEPGPPRGPATVTVDTPGRWGFRLIPRSGVGLAEPDPRPGEQPDVWVEVDNRAPVVKITNVTVTPGADAGKLTVYWTASDPFLTRLPITIFYRRAEGEDWKPLEKCENLGSFTCDPQKYDLPFQFSLKVQATDEAGNTGEDTWREPIKVDLKVPRIKTINVKIGEGQQQSRLPTPTPSPRPVPPGSAPAPLSRQGTPTGLPTWDPHAP